MQSEHILIILREFVTTIRTFIEYGGPLVDTAQLHRVEIQLVVAAFRTRLLYFCVFAALVDVFFRCGEPAWLGLRRTLLAGQQIYNKRILIEWY